MTSDKEPHAKNAIVVLPRILRISIEPHSRRRKSVAPHKMSWRAGMHGSEPHIRGVLQRGVLKPAQAHQVRACYGAKLTMIDARFGKLMASIDSGGFSDSNAVIVCTDYGPRLGAWRVGPRGACRRS
jgi:hypothetical protein